MLRKIFSVILIMSFVTGQACAGQALQVDSNRNLAPSYVSDPKINPERSAGVRNSITGTLEPAAIGSGKSLTEVVSGNLPERLLLTDLARSGSYDSTVRKLFGGISYALVNASNIKASLSLEDSERLSTARKMIVELELGVSRNAYFYRAINNGVLDNLFCFMYFERTEGEDRPLFGVSVEFLQDAPEEFIAVQLLRMAIPLDGILKDSDTADARLEYIAAQDRILEAVFGAQTARTSERYIDYFIGKNTGRQDTRPSMTGADNPSVSEAARFNEMRAAQLMDLHPIFLTGSDEIGFPGLFTPSRIMEVEFSITLEKTGEEKKFYGFRVQDNNARGPFKGGFRYDDKKYQELAKAKTKEEREKVLREALETAGGLAALMTDKTAVAFIPYGGGKGDVLLDKKDLTIKDIENITRGFVRALIDKYGVDCIGPLVDIPAPDMNTDAQIMGWFLDEYKNILIAKGIDVTGIERGVVTGKPVRKGGSKGREEATGRGVFLAAREAVKVFGEEYLGKGRTTLKDATVAIQGYGNVGAFAAKYFASKKAGSKLIAITNRYGGLLCEEGFSLADLSRLDRWIKEEKRRARLERGEILSDVDMSGFDFAKGFPGKKVRIITNQELLALDVDILAPCARQNEITAENAANVRARIIVEGANSPTTPKADEILMQRKGKDKVLIVPDILSNMGGVTVSYYEWVQNLTNEPWGLAGVRNMFEQRMINSVREGIRISKHFKVDGRPVTLREAAFILARARVANAEIARNEKLADYIRQSGRLPYKGYGQLGLYADTVSGINALARSGELESQIEDSEGEFNDAVMGTFAAITKAFSRLPSDRARFVLIEGPATVGKDAVQKRIGWLLENVGGKKVKYINLDLNSVDKVRRLVLGQTCDIFESRDGEVVSVSMNIEPGDTVLIEGGDSLCDDIVGNSTRGIKPIIESRYHFDIFGNLASSMSMEGGWPLTGQENRLMREILDASKRFNLPMEEAISRTVRKWPGWRGEELRGEIYSHWTKADATLNTYLPYEILVHRKYLLDPLRHMIDTGSFADDRKALEVAKKLIILLEGVDEVPDDILDKKIPDYSVLAQIMPGKKFNPAVPAANRPSMTGAESALRQILPVAKSVIDKTVTVRQAISFASGAISSKTEMVIPLFVAAVMESGKRGSDYGVSDLELATALRIMQLMYYSKNPVLTDLNLIRYAWAGRANGLKYSIPSVPGKPDVAEVWFNSTVLKAGKEDNPSLVTGTSVRIGDIEFTPIHLREISEDLTFFVKFLSTRFAPKVHMGFKTAVDREQFIGWLAEERKNTEELLGSLREGIAEEEFNKYLALYELWVNAEAAGQWSLTSSDAVINPIIKDIEKYLKPGVSAAKLFDKIARQRAQIVSLYNEIDLTENVGKAILSPAGHPHAIFGLSHQTHPTRILSKPDGTNEYPKNEAWIIITVKDEAGRDQYILVEPQQMSNDTYSFSDFYTPIVWKGGVPVMRKNVTSDDIRTYVTEGLYTDVATEEEDFVLEPVLDTPQDARNIEVRHLINGTYQPAWPVEYFNADLIVAAGKGETDKANIDMDVPASSGETLIVTKGEVAIERQGAEPVVLKAGTPSSSSFMPPAIGKYSITSTGEAEVLRFYPPSERPSMTGDIKSEDAGAVQLSIEDIIKVHGDAFKLISGMLAKSDPSKQFALILDSDIGDKQGAVMARTVNAFGDKLKEYFPNLIIKRASAAAKGKNSVAGEIASLVEQGVDMGNIFVVARETTVNQKGSALSNFAGSVWLTAVDDSKANELTMEDGVVRAGYIPVFEAAMLSMMAKLQADGKVDSSAIMLFYNNISAEQKSLSEIEEMLRSRIIFLLPRITQINIHELKRLYDLAAQAYTSA